MNLTANSITCATPHWYTKDSIILKII